MDKALQQRAILIGGISAGLLSAIPSLGMAVNCCCCGAFFLAGSFIAVYYSFKKSEAYVSDGDATVVGLGVGTLAGAMSGLSNALIQLLTDPAAAVQEMEQMLSMVPPQYQDFYREVMAQSAQGPTLPGLIFLLIMSIAMGAAYSGLGAFIFARFLRPRRMMGQPGGAAPPGAWPGAYPGGPTYPGGSAYQGGAAYPGTGAGTEGAPGPGASSYHAGAHPGPGGQGTPPPQTSPGASDPSQAPAPQPPRPPRSPASEAAGTGGAPTGGAEGGQRPAESGGVLWGPSVPESSADGGSHDDGSIGASGDQVRSDGAVPPDKGEEAPRDGEGEDRS